MRPHRLLNETLYAKPYHVAWRRITQDIAAIGIVTANVINITTVAAIIITVLHDF